MKRNFISMWEFADQIEKYIGQGFTFIEIGALDGKDSAYMKSRFPQARVCCFEADTDNYLKCSKLRNVEAYNHVVYNFNGEVSFYLKNQVDLHSCRNRGDEYGSNIVSKKCNTFPALTRKYHLPLPYVVKIDCEGCTYEVIQGMGSLLWNVKLLHIETEKDKFFEGQYLHDKVVRLLEDRFTCVDHLDMEISGTGKIQCDSIWVNNDCMVSE